MSKKEDNLLADSITSIRRLWRHRKGQEIPGAILDTFDNLGFVTKDLRRPVVTAKRKTEYGWRLIFRLPPGISFNNVTSKGEYFQDACNAWIEFKWERGLLHMDVQAGGLPESVSYEWGNRQYKDMGIPFPVGMSRRGMVVYDLAKGPHLLCAGETNFGKSNFIRTFIHAILPFARVAVLDFKGLDFYYLRRHCLVIEGQEEALRLLRQAAKEYERRKKILRTAGVEKIQLYHGKEQLPYLVIVIDEFAEIRLDGIVECIDTLVRLARAVGIHLVAATQRPGCDIIPGRTRSQFPMRICFPVVDGVDSRMILGEQFSQAARLPAIPGRALFRHGIELVEVQTMNLPMETAKLMLGNSKKEEWGFEQQNCRLLPR